MREDRFIMHEGEMKLLSNQSLACKDCKYVYPDPKTAVCEVYDNIKPKVVLDSGPCDFYERKYN